MRTATASIKATKRGIGRPLYGGVSWDPERARGRATQVPACRDNKIEQFRSAWVPVVVVPTDHGRSMLTATIARPWVFMPATQSARFGHRSPQEMLPQRSGLLGGGTTVRVKLSARSRTPEEGESHAG